MKRICILLAGLAAIALPRPAVAQSPLGEAALEQGFAAALEGCALWVLDPASWANGPQPFIDALDLGNRLVLAETVEPIALPPPEFQQNNHFWRINATSTGGFILVVSDRLPICHMTGGADTDLQPMIERVLASESFAEVWATESEEVDGDTRSTVYRHRDVPSFVALLTRAPSPGGRVDKVQVILTALLDLEGTLDAEPAD